MYEEINSEDLSVQTVFKLFPFLSSFPFNDYKISIDKISDSIEVDPLVAKETSYNDLYFINFTYQYGESDICFSFYTFDIEFICSVSKKVRKLDSVREKLDKGLTLDGISDKLIHIKEGEKFIKKLGPSLLAGDSFDGILDEMLKLAEVEADSKIIYKIKNLKEVNSEELDYNTFRCAADYYDLHLHHIKILLGIVIAHKIY